VNATSTIVVDSINSGSGAET